MIVSELEEGPFSLAVDPDFGDAGDLFVRVRDGLEVFEIALVHGGSRPAARVGIVVGTGLGASQAKPPTPTEAESESAAATHAEHALLEHVGIGGIGEGRQVEHAGVRQVAASVRRRYQIVGVSKGKYRRDVAVCDDEIHERPRFWLAHHVWSRIALPVRVGMLEVAVEVDAAGAVFVEIAVPIGVGALPVQGVRPRFTFGRICFPHEPGLVRIDDVGTRCVGNAHHGDDPIAV